ncbi:hypothetical protein GLI01_23930 [Gluconacetobacter liquefaciens]|uniref:Uncharacterized protein n=1 Tax=Gluconacetobacter liquefaciens TaxID=89584 RepID=A0A370G2Y5_GLULI|nr:hypothetical protein [Gluconacetobacter liquefaciens]MBB2186440.1 hypothetical protein [Gluconacetobacter liquefaciens]RDI38105.1 hypothetical protein C7453_10442 [Gluconacetobacter liquefaciens]GEB38358.1 hypothetical protein GLI01_23930 [Gluconacetobacter liquefaciens]
MKVGCTRAALLLILAMPALAGCGGGKAAPAGDAVLDQAMESGQQSAGLERLTVAEGQYRQAGTRALARDDAGAIGDAGYNLAVVQLAQDKPADALSTLAATRAALAVRGRSGADAGLDLTQAAALHRLSRDREAAPLAAGAMASPDLAIAEQASLLTGLIADGMGDRTMLAQAVAHLAHKRPVAAKWQADEDELQARMRLPHDPAGARDLAVQAADLRRQMVDYRGMARVLTLAARAAGQAGDAAGAAALTLQAGQSLHAQSPGVAPAIGAPDPFVEPAPPV